MQVQVTPNVTLLGLGLQRVLQDRLQDPKTARRIRKLRGCIEVRIGQQSAYITVDPELIIVSGQRASKVRARLIAPDNEWLALLEGGAGRGAAIIARLEGRVRLSGNPFVAMRLLSILGAPKRTRSKIRLARELARP